MPAPTLAETLHPRANGLNALRLVLALSVILWHSFPLTGRSIGSAPVEQMLSQLGVDGFFAVSGFLILGSWTRRPHLGRFVEARCLRILPGFWVCLLTTALVIAPAALVVSGEGVPPGFGRDAAHYVVGQMALRPVGDVSLGGTPLWVPFPGAWNGSLWTLQWEFACYAAVCVVGTAGLLARRWTVVALHGAAVTGVVGLLLGPAVHPELAHAGRFAVMFTAGAVLYRYRRAVPVRGVYLAGAASVVLASSLLPDYRLVAALPLSYLLVAGASLVGSPRLHLARDVSYGTYLYAFPVQQLLAGVWVGNVVLFTAATVIITVPLAAASWAFVESPALSLRSRAPRRSRGAREPRPGSQARTGAVPPPAQGGGSATVALRTPSG